MFGVAGRSLLKGRGAQVMVVITAAAHRQTLCICIARTACEAGWCGTAQSVDVVAGGCSLCGWALAGLIQL